MFSPQKKITTLLKEKDFTLSVELLPPRNGSPLESYLSKLKPLRNLNLDFITVTKSAGGSLRAGTIPISLIASKELSVPVVTHLTTLDYSKEQLENILIDQNYLGLTNILALRGDPPIGQEKEYLSEPKSYRYAYQLVEHILNLNSGNYLIRKNTDDIGQGIKTDFCIGAAAYPNEPDVKKHVGFLKRKVGAGAEYAITQMIYDVESYSGFITEAKNQGIDIKIIPGIYPVYTYKLCNFVQTKFNTKIPDKFKESLKGLSEKECKVKALDFYVQLVKEFRRAKAPGMHFFCMLDIGFVVEIVRKIKEGI